jgi:hypothetical protein
MIILNNLTMIILNNLTITGLAFIMVILSMLNAVSKPKSGKDISKYEAATRILSVFLAITIFAWLMGIQQFYILHQFTGQTIIENDNSSMSVEYFKENVLNELPNQTWNGVAIITLKQFIEIKEQGNYFYETYGIYYPSSHEIKLKVMPLSDMRRNMAHEAAHWYWFDKLTDAQRKEWTQLYAKTQRFSSSYARTNEKEDFAETVSFIVAWKSVTTDQEKIDFIVKNYLKPLHLDYEITKSSSGDFFVVQQQQT